MERHTEKLLNENEIHDEDMVADAADDDDEDKIFSKILSWQLPTN